MGHRAAHSRPRPAGQFRHVRAGREHRRPRDRPLAARAQPRPDAGLEVPGGAGCGRGGDLQGHRAFEPGAGALLHRVFRLRGDWGRRRLRDPRRRDRAVRELAGDVPAGLRWRRQPDPPRGRHRHGGAGDARGVAERILARRSLALPVGARGGRLPGLFENARRAAGHHPKHQRPRPLAQHHPDRPGEGRAAAAVDLCGDDRDHPTSTSPCSTARSGA